MPGEIELFTGQEIVCSATVSRSCLQVRNLAPQLSVDLDGTDLTHLTARLATNVSLRASNSRSFDHRRRL